MATARLYRLSFSSINKITASSIAVNHRSIQRVRLTPQCFQTVEFALSTSLSHGFS